MGRVLASLVVCQVLMCRCLVLCLLNCQRRNVRRGPNLERSLSNYHKYLDTIHSLGAGLRPQLHELLHHLESAPMLSVQWRHVRLAVLRLNAELEIAVETEKVTQPEETLRREISQALNPSGRP